jgi:hypothetical protein
VIDKAIPSWLRLGLADASVAPAARLLAPSDA